MRAVRDHAGNLHIVGHYHYAHDYNGQGGEVIPQLDVGEVLELRLSSLSLHHHLVRKTHLYTHIRQGSGHGMTEEQIAAFLSRFAHAKEIGCYDCFR